MADNQLQKRISPALKEKGQYVLGFGVVAAVLLVTGFPPFIIFFFGIFAFFLWKIFSTASKGETREIFEFYLAANDILRNDERRWFGFEMKEVAARGEAILKNMSAAPPLVYFTLGALYNKMGDHESAVRNLSVVVENESSDESSIVFPSPELRNYARILRKIEREPTEAPLTSRAVRALERARKNRASALLEQSREAIKFVPRTDTKQVPASVSVQEHGLIDRPVIADIHNTPANGKNRETDVIPVFPADEPLTRPVKTKENAKDDQRFTDRKSISEVLHDIYDRNIQ